MIPFRLEWSTAVWTGRARIKKRMDLMLQHALLDDFEQLLRLRERQAQVLKAAVVFLQGNDISDGFFLAIIVANNELQFDAHGETSVGLHGG
jgi:hypothetical protein